MTSSSRQNVLIVDDAPLNIKLLATVLRGEYGIMVANSGERALELCRSETPPDLILLDVVMPGLDGFLTCKRLKEDPLTRDIPILFITALEKQESELQGLSLGAVDYITKPFAPAVVKARVHTHIELRRKTRLLEDLAMLDGLTEIPNRRYFEDALQREWRRNIRAGTPVAIIMTDVDKFKECNDKYGHGAGDRLLRNVAKALHESVGRPGDVLARYGGDEFVALLPDTGRDQAHQVADKMLAATSKLPAAEGLPAGVSISIGLAAMIPTQDSSPQDLINAADSMLYKAKNEGRSRVAG